MFPSSGKEIVILSTPEEMTVGPDTARLLSDVEVELAQLRALGDFSEEVREQIAKEFLPQRIVDTLAIEGFQVNVRVTRAVLEGRAVAEADRYSTRGIENIIRASEFIQDSRRDDRPITSHSIRELHALVTDGQLEHPGSYRETAIEITGAAFSPPGPEAIAGLVQEICEAQFPSADVHPLQHAVWAHRALAAVHPFPDGNGRTARLLQDWMLIRSGYLPVGIPANRRNDYYAALERADRGEWDDLVLIVAGAQLSALEKTKRIASAPEKRLARIRALASQVQDVARHRDYGRYEAWRRRTDGILDEFQRWVADLTTELPDLDIRIRTYEPIDFEKWQTITHRGWATGTWVFSFVISIRGTLAFEWLFYARRHEWNFTSDYDERQRNVVGLFLEGRADPSSPWTFDQYFDRYVRLRELIYIENELTAYVDPSDYEIPPQIRTRHHDGARPVWVPEHDVAVGDIVETFIVENLVRLGLVDPA